MSDSEVSLVKVLLIEYEQVKAEQTARIGFRDNLLYVTLAAMAAVIAATLPLRRANLLLLLPPVSIVLGWTYLVNDEKISAIGRYLRSELGPRLSTAVPGGPVVLGWETVHRTDARRTSRKYLQLAVDLLAFCVAPVAAVVVYLINGPWPVPFVVLAVIEVAAVTVLGVEIVRYADLAADVPAPPA